SLKTLYRKRTVIWPFYFYTIIRTLSDLIFLLLFIVLACTFLTPILGVPIGIIVYLLLFLDDEDDIIDEIETMNQQIDKKD
ncbi:hypothetical protein, partial [Staphylococcus gallinarum]|uniref:hypothetical protein n=1 Tax=Staphylococcus gallinarum TaxID=1293 RepID=UPI0031788C3A